MSLPAGHSRRALFASAAFAPLVTEAATAKKKRKGPKKDVIPQVYAIAWVKEVVVPNEFYCTADFVWRTAGHGIGLAGEATVPITFKPNATQIRQVLVEEIRKQISKAIDDPEFPPELISVTVL